MIADVRGFHSKRICLLMQTYPFMKVDCSALRAPAIAASIRNPGCRPPYSYRLARPISMILRVQARSGSWLLYGTFIANIDRFLVLILHGLLLPVSWHLCVKLPEPRSAPYVPLLKAAPRHLPLPDVSGLCFFLLIQ